MKKHLWLLFILLLLIGCGPSGGQPADIAQEPAASNVIAEVAATAVPTATSAPTAPPEPTNTTQPTAEPETNDEPESTTETEEPGTPSNELAATTFPATTVEEAAVIRDNDWAKGATDPAVTIIEYGDFQ